MQSALSGERMRVLLNPGLAYVGRTFERTRRDYSSRAVGLLRGACQPRQVAVNVEMIDKSRSEMASDDERFSQDERMVSVKMRTDSKGATAYKP